MSRALSRRDFLKISGLALGSLAFSNDFPPGQWEYEPGLLGRVAYPSVSVFDAPVLNAQTVGYRFRDELLHIYKVVRPLSGPAYNPVWYRVWGGYVHSAFIQTVEVRLNPVLDSVPEAGLLTELTVPYSQPFNYSSPDGWEPNTDFYLYYQSTHWITDVVEGRDGQPWYQITDELDYRFRYYVPAGHLRPIPVEELTPISPEVPPDEKRIEISLKWQVLSAIEGDNVVFRTRISSGVDKPTPPGSLPTQTPVGLFFIQSKMPSKHMGAGRLTDNLDDRALPGVPWTAFFEKGGYAIHGAYWHNNFGWPMSRGCVNMRYEDAKWLFRWTNPVWDPQAVSDYSDWEARRQGTRVDIVEE
jgi:hypothetical protein